MKTVILAAGKGTRMGPLTENRPKAMLPIANRPLLEHIILALKEADIREIFIIIGYQKEKITEYFGNGRKLGVKIDYIAQEKQKGTGGAIAVARNSMDERFLVTNGDSLVDVSDIKKLCSAKGDVVLAAKRVESPKEYGILYVKDGMVEKIVEKPEESTSDIANAGIYVFEPSIFDAIDNTGTSPRGEYEITDAIQSMIDSGKRSSYIVLEKWQDLGFPWHLLVANEMILNYDMITKKEDIILWKVLGEVEPYATLKGNVSVGEGTVIRNGAYIIGPVMIGRNCDIGPNCYIRSSTSIGDEVGIGNAVEVKNSIIMNETHIGHLSYVGDSIIGERCNFGAGTKVANLRHDGRTILVELNGKKFDSKRRKLGTIMGDNVHTGINSSINMGTTIACGTNINPGTFIRRSI